MLALEPIRIRKVQYENSLNPRNPAESWLTKDSNMVSPLHSRGTGAAETEPVGCMPSKKVDEPGT